MFSWGRKQSSSSGSPSSSSGRRRGGTDASMDSSSRGGGGSGSRGRSPRLDRRNAAKRIEYEVGAGASASVGASWSSSSSAEQQRSPGLRPSRSLDLAPCADLRISGSAEGEVDELCRSLGLSGPEEFAIPLAAWEARKSRSNSDLLPRPRLVPSPAADELSPIARAVSAPNVQPALSVPAPIPEESLHSSSTSTATESAEEPTVAAPEESPKAAPAVAVVPPVGGLPLPSPKRGGGESFAPSEERSEFGGAHERAENRHVSDTEEEEAEDGVAAVEGELKELRIGETFEGFTGTSSLSTTNDDDASSTTTEAMFIISPNGKFKRKIKSWMRGALLGSGSFGMVYEGISDEGAFFAVKEVSLLDQGSNAQQSILALEQEIALLSQFEHENIVQYYGTDKEESKLYIFIELVTQGSLSSLYQRYKLRESQVSAYTRQILNGLLYLHERNVVHRDIKCANILVHANGSVKLADFGLAKEMSKINMLRSCKGSVYWMAPEVINPKKMYGPSADIWSLGCTVLEMLTRQIPFPNVEWTNAFFMIGRGEQPPIPNYLSKEAQDFIGQCVRVDPENRPSASQLLEHPFVNRPLRASFESSPPGIPS
ncbi:mitogen-activated protein kinase kinase kinase 1-like isoform X2 [Panicum hallii]|uniref:mitogen-activated protein kinase kinase kinase 1-like isoform X2 n=1 Tax=Panicum hallii TaxID=206008 RepID=UPI000DF4D07A|nr:mitogen-activated protein kinase kinase kinase 1-like isoform X2 [Panicum hallii]